MKKRIACVLAAGLAALFAVAAGESPVAQQPRTIRIPAQFPIPRIETAPEIDGDLEDAAWRHAPSGELRLLAALRREGTERVPSYPAWVKAVYDDENLYVAFDCRNAADTAAKAGREIYQDDCVEFFLNPEKGAGFKQILVNIRGQAGVNYVGARPLYELKPEDIRFAVREYEGGWRAEMALPLARLGIDPGQKPVFAGNFARENPAANEYTSLADLQTHFHEEKRFLQLCFSDAFAAIAPVTEESGMLTMFSGTVRLPVAISGFAVEAQQVIPVAVIGGDDGGEWREYPGTPFELRGGDSVRTDCELELGDGDTGFRLELRQMDSGRVVAASGDFRFEEKGLAGEITRQLERLAQLPEAPETKALRRELESLRRTVAHPGSEEEWQRRRERAEDQIHTVERLALLAAQGRWSDLAARMSWYPASSLTKVFAAESVPEECRLGGAVELDGSRDEYLNFQVVLLPLYHDLPEPVPVISVLTGPGGANIPSDAIELFRVKPVIVDGRYWPDILDRNLGGAMPRAANQQPFWGIVHIPPEAAAGEYTGSIEFQLPDGSIKVPLTLRVRDFRLPETGRMNAMIFYYPEELPAPSPAGDPEAVMVADLIAHGLYPIPALSHPRSLDSFPFGLDRFYPEKTERFDFTVVSIVPWLEWLEKFYDNGRFATPAAYYENQKNNIVRDAARVREDGRLATAYVYYDEVNTAQQEVRDVLNGIKLEAGLKIITCFCTPSLGVEKVRYYEDMVDWFFFNDGYFTDPALLEYIRSLQAKGRRVGWYFNMSYPAFPSSNCIDAPGVANRIQFFQQWKYGIDASLFWGANSWWPNDLSGDPPVMAQRGDGLLLYPSESCVYVPSIRYELLREGTQDYRYLAALEAMAEQAAGSADAAAVELCRRAREILRVPWIDSIVDYPENPRVLEQERKKLMDCTEELARYLKK